jgi:hypothetical protein
LFNPKANTVTLAEVARIGAPLAATFLNDASGDISMSTPIMVASEAMLRECFNSLLIFVLLLLDLHE